MWSGAAIILLFLLILLSIPVTLQFALSWPDTSGNDVRLGWAFGLVHVRIGRKQSLPAEASRPARSPKARGKPKKLSKAKPDILPVLGERKIRQRAMRFVNDLVRAVHKDGIRISARIGLGDPADTGRLWSILGPLSTVLSSIRSASITILPEFMDTVLDIDARGRLRVIPIQIIGHVVALLFSPVFWLAMRRLRSST
jgi:hypothetical protein